MTSAILPPGLAGDLDVLAFAEAELAVGRPAALITIVGLDGPFSRPLGAQLAVAGDKRFAGSISGGCLEQALTEEAQVAMREGSNRVLRYGRGSPYLDVRLPCGGGIDLHVDASPDRVLLQNAIALGRARKLFTLGFNVAAPRSTLRLIESHHPDKPRLGTARRPADEPIRLGQAADMSFAPGALHAVAPATGLSKPRIEVRMRELGQHER